MGAQRSSFAKLQRDRAKKAKAAAKREQRQNRDETTTEELPPPPPSGDGELSAGELLVMVERLHKQFESKAIDLETFEEQKADLMARLPID